MQQALGLIETKGLLAAIESADAMLKAAEVSLLDRTLVGGGLVTISVTGDVAAVKASVEAGTAAVSRIDASLLVSDHVIPRPHTELDDVILPAEPLKDRKAPVQEPQDAEPEAKPEPEITAEPETAENGYEPESIEPKPEPPAEPESTESEPENTEPKEAAEPEPETPAEPENTEPEPEPSAEVQSSDDEPETAEPENTEPEPAAGETESVTEHAVRAEPDSYAVRLQKTQERDETESDAEPETERVSEPVRETETEIELPADEIHREDLENLIGKHGLTPVLDALGKCKVMRLRHLAREYEDFGISGRMISKADKKTLIAEFENYYQ